MPHPLPPTSFHRPTSPPSRFRTFGAAVIVVTTVLLTYLALRASPNLREVPWLPGWLSRWADVNGVARNTAAFLPFGLLVFTLVGRRWPHVLAISAFAIGIEVAQIWIPSRVFDLKDIAASLAGIAAAWVVVTLVGRLRPGPDRDLPASTPPP